MEKRRQILRGVKQQIEKDEAANRQKLSTATPVVNESNKRREVEEQAAKETV